MAEKLGIESLKKVIDLGIELEKLAEHMIKNGANWQADISDGMAHLPALIMDVQAVVASVGAIPAELKDLDGEEAVALVGYVGSKLAIENEKAAKIVSASLKLAAHVIADGIELAKAIKE